MQGSDGDLLPVEPPPAIKVDILADPFHIGTVTTRQLFDFLNRNRVHAAIRFQRAVAQCQRDDTSRLEQGDAGPAAGRRLSSGSRMAICFQLNRRRP